MPLDAQIKFERMEYRSLGAGAIAAENNTVASPEAGPRGMLQAQLQEMRAEIKEREGAAQRLLEEARREAFERGRRQAEQEANLKVESSVAKLAKVLASFHAERDEYFSRVEHEVVQLALAIAGRILRREAQLDPLLLSGAVRVALGQLAESTAVKLRVPASELALWEEMLRLMPNLPLRPEVMGEETFSAGDCVLETHLGSVDLGVRTQLVEIERGFFDLLEQRPPASSNQETA